MVRVVGGIAKTEEQSHHNDGNKRKYKWDGERHRLRVGMKIFVR